MLNFVDRLLVTESGCWEFQGSRNQKGYGLLCRNKTTVATHRRMWALVRGEVPSGMLVCHHCDNPPCCNPGHLFLGSDSDNMLDCSRKNRFKFRNNENKLTEDQVRAIRRIYSTKSISMSVLASAYGVSKQTINRTAKRTSHGRVEDWSM